MNHRWWRLILSLAAALLATPTLHAAAPIERFALVVGSNKSGRADLKDLQYADDDAVRNYELLTSLGVKTRLVVSLDPQTQANYPWAALQARPANRADLTEEVKLLLTRASAARAAGSAVELYFWYSGHGGASGTQVGLLLHDGSFTSRDLRELIEGSAAQYNHIIIDACHASSLVGARGSEEVDAKLQQSAENADVPPMTAWKNFENTGLVLARGLADAKTYEWFEYQGGVVSHEVRSGLSGAADLTPDGRVTYSELESFVTAANAGVDNPQARPQVEIIPPARNVYQVLVDWTAVKPRTPARLLLRQKLSGHLFVEDASGARLTEIHKEAGQRVELFLVPRKQYFATFNGRELGAFSLHPRASLDFEALRRKPAAGGAQARGPRLDQAFREGLFKVQFGRAFHAGFCGSSQRCETQPPLVPDRDDDAAAGLTKKQISAYALLGGSALSLGGGIAFYVASNHAYERYRDTAGSERENWKTRTERYDWGATLSFGLASAAFATGSGLLLHDWLKTDSQVVAAPAGVGWRGRF